MSSAAANLAIERTARRLRFAVLAAMVVMGALYVAGRFGLQVGGARVEYRTHGPDLPVTRLFADVTVALLLLSLFRLTQMLDRIASGELFSAEAVGHFRSFAFWLLVTAAISFVSPVAGALIGVASDPRHVELTINFRDVLTVGVTLLLFLLARLLERARQLDEEMREIV